MKQLLFFLAIGMFLFPSCKSSKGAGSSGNKKSSSVTTISTDKTYGFTQENPIKVGGTGSGPANERKYLDALAGPNGESISYVRVGSCCPFNTPNGLMGGGMLDRYEIKWSGQTAPVYLYLNMYDKDELKAPVGFTIK
jgi:hypothetical protein